MISDDYINELLSRVDIEDVISPYVQFKRTGSNLQGLCPFHQEKSPSFTVSVTKQFYHCFGCGAHGSAIGFLINHNGLTFVEAIQELSNRVGLKVPEQRKKNNLEIAQEQKLQQQSLSMLQIMQSSCEHYIGQLNQSPEAQEYLTLRQLSPASCEQFLIGYSPFNNSLKQIFGDYQNSTVLVEAGMVKISEKDQQPYDFFRKRLMFPIRNIKGQVIGFGGRILDKGQPKYLNSPETPLFQKNKELYGLFEAKSAISQSGFVLVVEGYMDVVSLAQSDIQNAVATLGTATSSEHLKKLFRFTDTIVCSFDGDAAGRKAAWRAMNHALPLIKDNQTIKFLFLPPEHDPDTFVKEKGKDAFLAEVHNAMSLTQFMCFGLAQMTKENTPEARAKQMAIAKPMLQELTAPALRIQMLNAIADQIQVSSKELGEYAELSSKPNQAKRPQRQVKRKAPTSIDAMALQLILLHPNLIHFMQPDLWYPYQNPLLHELLHKLPQIEMNTTFNFNHFIEQLDHANDLQHEYAKVINGFEIDLEEATQEINQLENKLKLQKIERELVELAPTIAINPQSRAKYRDLMEQMRQLKQKI